MKKKVFIAGLSLAAAIYLNSCIGVLSSASNLMNQSQSLTGDSNPLGAVSSFKQKMDAVSGLLTGELWEKVKSYQCLRGSVETGMNIPALDSQISKMFNSAIEKGLSAYKQTEKGKDFDIKICVDEKECPCKVTETVIFKYKRANLGSKSEDFLEIINPADGSEILKIKL